MNAKGFKKSLLKRKKQSQIDLVRYERDFLEKILIPKLVK